MDEAALHKLGFPDIRQMLAAYCGCALGRRQAEAMKPSTRFEQVEGWLAEVRELLKFSETGTLPPLAGVHDIRPYIKAAAFPAPLEPPTLAEVAETLHATGPLRAWINEVTPAAPSLARLGSRIHDLTAIATVINESVDPRGQVRDYASPRLASIRGAIERSRAQVRTVFDRLLRQSSITKMLQYAAVTYHDDRMVLPLKAEYRGRVPGIIHRSSDSGSTLFVEPAESVELNNSIVRLRDEEKREITAILRRLSQLLHANSELILSTVRAISVLDLVAAKCRYAKRRACVCPVLRRDGVLDLHEARHPLLLELFEEEADEGGAKREVVPIDIRLGEDFDILMITGPNTGGKTVAIKTVGLLALMTQCGMPIPAAEGSSMPVYRNVFIDIGDEQSIQQSLSTFSSHLSNLLSILQRGGAGSLVLIDELGAGTDPDEGAAIGRAILSELLRIDARAVVTTHLSALKAEAFTQDRVDNASVEFDSVSLRPTYRLRLGEPGNSNALIIAKRLGMPARLVKFARECLDDSTRALNRAIAGTLDSRREAEAARRSARESALASDRERAVLEEKQVALQREQEAFARWSVWVNALKPGDAVYLRSLERSASVVRMQLHRQSALVTAGAMDIEVPLRDIDMPRPDAD